MHLLGAIGLTLILVRGGVFARLRRLWPAPFSCALCMGWWVGWAVGIAQDRAAAAANLLEIALFAGAVSACALGADYALAWIDDHTGAARP